MTYDDAIDTLIYGFAGAVLGRTPATGPAIHDADLVIMGIVVAIGLLTAPEGNYYADEHYNRGVQMIQAKVGI